MREIEPDTCWVALAVCILTTKTIEQAFDSLVNDPQTNIWDRRKADTADMYVMYQQGVRPAEIARIYNITTSNACKRIKRYKECDKVAFTYYCDHCNKEPLYLNKDRCPECGHEVIKIPRPNKHVVSNDCKGTEITD